MQHTVVPEILIPDKGRVRLSPQHFAGELESSVQLTLVAVHVDKVAWRERKGRSARRGSLRKAAANTVAIKLYAFYIHGYHDGVRTGSAAGECRPEGASPIWPPEPALRKMRRVAVNRNIDAVFIPEGIAEADGDVVGSGA